MKPRRLLWTSSALCLLIASCDKSEPTSAASGGNDAAESLAAERAALEDERIALERQRLEDERAALEEEKAALEAEREARLADREQQADQRDLTLEERQQALADREIDLRNREGDLADREAGLNDRELELAGREPLEDWEPEPVADFQEPVADYGTFYDDLQPYGSWIETPDYGYVYQPTIVVQDNSWRPYTRGRWACTNLGWTWVSDEPFGWACFHYGRWTLLGGHGWVWVPGDEWAPSWVCWREGGDCIGWAPLPPETLCYRGRGWGSSVESDFGIGHALFSFVHCRHMADPIWRHCLPVAQNNIFIRQTVNITNIQIHRDRVVSGGPRYEKLRALVGKSWPVYQLETDRYQGVRDLERRKPRMVGNRLAMFAPNLNARWNDGLKPSRVVGKWDDVKVVRSENGIKPEWAERFRETRQKKKEEAVAWKRENASGDDAQKKLQANREKVAEAQRAYEVKQRELVEARREKQMEKREQQASKNKPLPSVATDRSAASEKAAQGEGPARKPSLAERQRELAERMRESRAQADRQPEASREAPAERMTRPSNPPATGATENRREHQPQQPVVPHQQGDDGKVAQEESRRERLEEARRQQQEQMRQRQVETRQRQEEARQTQEQSRNDAEENTRRERMEQARLERQEAAQEKAEQARQQQQERQRQMEENRQRQQDEARERQEQARRQTEDNQHRQQQEEMQRQQQEQARQQQEERARQQQEERARQQEQERARQEERMREQQERARQQEEERARKQEEMQRRQEEARREAEERARQQQEERARQQEEMQRRQEEARREAEERARQQQEERQRQQEEARRQQEERQREQQERARQEQEERSRRQQEENDRQRGR